MIFLWHGLAWKVVIHGAKALDILRVSGALGLERLGFYSFGFCRLSSSKSENLTCIVQSYRSYR